MKQRLVNLLAAALVALAVSTTIGGASPSPISTALYVTATRGGHATPPARHGISTAVLSRAKQSPPSVRDELHALERRVDANQHHTAHALDVARAAAQVAGCVGDIVPMKQDPETGDFTVGDPATDGVIYVLTTTAGCVS